MKTFLKSLAATAVILALIATPLWAQDQQMCAQRVDMHAEMTNAGYEILFIGLVYDQTFVDVVWLNESTGEWMIHSIEMASDVECHMSGGSNYKVVFGDPV